MTKHLHLTAIAIGAFAAWGHVRTASAGPAWCKGATFDDDVDLKDLSSSDPRRVVEAFALASCAPSAEVEARRADIDKGRAAWGKRLGMNDADWGDVVAWIKDGDGGRDVKLEYSTKEVTKFTPIDQYKAITDGFSAGGNAGGSFRDVNYVADALDMDLSQVARFAYLQACLGATTSVTSSAPPAADWAMCQGDIEKFDLAKFHAELRADTAHGGDVKMQIRFRAMNMKKQLEEHAAAVEKAWKLDPVYKQMFDVAAAARTEWASGLGANPKLLELARRMDSAVWSASRKQFENCEVDTEAALIAAIGKLPSSTFKDMKDERYDPTGGFASLAGPVLAAIPEINLAAGAYVVCRPEGGTAAFLAAYLRDTVGFRGPRSAALASMLKEKLTLDDMSERLYWPRIRRPEVNDRGTSGSAGGVVAKTTIEGDLVIVELERYIVKREECIESHATKRISRILPDGEIEYEQVCDKMGVVEHDQTWDDFKIKKQYAPLLKKGVKFSAVIAKGGSEIIALWPNKKTENPTWLLGAVIK